MLKSIEQTLGKTCVIGLSYFDVNENIIKQSILAGTVKAAEHDKGIEVALLTSEPTSKESAQAPVFIIPANLSCWFVAPKGNFHTSDASIAMLDPDYLVTWDIYQTKPSKQDGEQQWWKWLPRTTSPQLTQ